MPHAEPCRAGLPSCLVYTGYIRPGRDAADIIAPFQDTHVTVTVPRDGEIQRWQRSATSVERPDKSSTDAKVFQERDERGWERTATGREKSPTSDIVFKCVDTGSAVVVGARATEEDGEQERGPSVALSDLNPLTARVKEEEPVEANSAHGICVPEVARPAPSRQEGKGEDIQPPSDYSVDRSKHGEVHGGVVDARRVSAMTLQGGAGKVGNDDGYEGNGDIEQAPRDLAVSGGMHSRLLLDTTARRPQVCVPLVGVGDSGCIGMIGVQGFSSGVIIDDSDWRDWFAARMSPFDRDENRAVKRLKLVRPRGLPTRGKLDNVPSGIAAKVVYGSVEKVIRKRGMPLYAVM